VAYLILLKNPDLKCMTETRLQVAETRTRIPDLCVYVTEPEAEVPQEPPDLVVEILSPDDRWPRVHKRLQDFAAWGCPCAWVLDPQAREAFRFDHGVPVPVTNELAHPSVPGLRLALADLGW